MHTRKSLHHLRIFCSAPVGCDRCDRRGDHHRGGGGPLRSLLPHHGHAPEAEREVSINDSFIKGQPVNNKPLMNEYGGPLSDAFDSCAKSIAIAIADV